MVVTDFWITKPMSAVWISHAEVRNLKDPEQVENLQAQSQVLLGQHIHSVYPNQGAR